MAQDILETKWDEVLGSLEAEGLPKEKAREVLPKAVAFLFEVTRKKKEQYLANMTLRTRRETLDRLIKIAQKYPGVRGLLANLYHEEVEMEGRLSTSRILQLCEEISRIGLAREWTYLGKVSRKWRLTGTESGEVGIPPNVLNAGIHVYDFLSEDRRMRHFLPTDWRNRVEIGLVGYLADQVKQNEAEYRAAHSEKFAKKSVDPGLTTAPLQREPKKGGRKTTKGGRKIAQDSDKDGKSPIVKPPKGGRSAAKRQAIEQGLDEAEI